ETGGKLIYVSDARVYPGAPKAYKTGPATETFPIDKAVTLIGRAHADAEKVIRGEKLPCIILRPAVVYGKGDVSGLTPRLICSMVYQQLKEPMKFLWDGKIKMNCVHVIDVAAAMWHCALNVPIGSTFNLVDRSDLDVGKLNAMLEGIFKIKTGFHGKIICAGASAAMGMATNTVNEKHIQPWADLCKANKVSTFLSPYLDADMLGKSWLFASGDAIIKTKFKYTHRMISIPLLKEVLDDYVARKIIPPYK
ncbi:hypothetical protein ADUPG1_007293, partial [Aduncisulcus paluster]